MPSLTTGQAVTTPTYVILSVVIIVITKEFQRTDIFQFKMSVLIPQFDTEGSTGTGSA